MEIQSVSTIRNLNNINPVYGESGREQTGKNIESGSKDRSEINDQKDTRNPYAGNNSELSPKEKRDVEQLKSIDISVRSHELAHISAGGQFVKGGARFQYQTGPDGNRYAVAGEVGIDSSPIPGDPKATAEKMEKIKTAALAPVDPSNQDRRVAGMASQIRAEALMELSLLQVKNRLASDMDQKKTEISFPKAAAVYESSNNNIRIGSTVDLMM
jgi:hypothetical protein